MANNIEQQWANIGLARDLAQMPTDTTTPVENSIYKNIEDKIAGLQSAATTKLQNLTNTTEPKVRNLEGYEDVTITGLLDADTVKLADGRTVRMSDPLVRYDATEISHPGDDSFLSKVKDVFGIFSKSDVAEDQQRRHASMLLGKQPHEVSEQDLIDIGNMQQNQMLADLQRGQGQERNLVELVPGIAQSDFSKNLNIQAKLKTSANTDMYNRVTGSLVNPNTMQDVGSLHANDPRLNTFSKEARNYGFKIDEAGNRVDTLDIGKSSLGNAAAGFGYTLGEGIVNTLDLIPEVVEYAYGNMVGDKAWKDTKGLYDTKESEAFKKWIGYSDTVLNNIGQQGVAAVKDAWENGDYWGLAKAAVDAVTTPELSTVSLGYVLGMVLPGGAAKKAVDIVSKIDKTADALVLADKTGKLSKAEALAKAQSEAGVGYKIASTLAGNVGFVSEAEQFGRDAEALYKETYNEEMPTEQKMLARAGGLLYAKMDAAIAKAIVLGKDPMAKLVPEAVKALPDAMKANLAGKVAVLSGATAARVAGVFGLEAGTEMIQTSMEKIAGMYKEGERGVLDILDEQKYEIGSTGLLGGVGGIQMGAPSIALDAVGGSKGLADMYNSTSKMVGDKIGTKSREPLPEEESAFTTPTSGLKSMSTEDLQADLAAKVKGFAEAAQNNTDISPEDLQYAREVKSELKSRQLAEGLKSKTLGSISDIERYLAENDIATEIENKPLEDIVARVIDSQIENEEITDIQIALKNIEGVKDREKWNKVIDDAVNFRLSLDKLETEAAQSRLGVVVEGLLGSNSEDRRGYTEYAREALNGSEKAYSNMTRFISVQNNKIDKLTSLHNDLLDKVNTQIDNVLAKAKENKSKVAITREDVVRAMAFMKADGNQLISTEEKAKLQSYYFKVMDAIPKIDGKNDWKSVAIEGDKEVDYSEEFFSRSKNEGKFKNNYFEVIPEIAAELGINDIQWNENRRQSSVSKVISYINEEVADMERLSKYVGERAFGIKGDAEVDTETTTQSEAEVKPAEEIQQVDEVEPTEEVQPDEVSETVKEPAVEETKKEEVTEKAALEETQTETKPKEYSKVAETLENLNDLNKNELETLLNNIASLGKVSQSESERESLRDAYKRVNSRLKDIADNEANKKLDEELYGMTLEDLRTIISRNYKDADSNYRKSRAEKIFAKKQQEIIDRADIEISDAIATYNRVEVEKLNDLNELVQLENTNKSLFDKAKKLTALDKKIENALARRDDMKVQLANYKKIVASNEKKVAELQAKYDEMVSTYKKEALELENLDVMSRFIKKSIRGLNSLATEIREALVKIASKLKSALKVLEKNKSAEKELELELEGIEKEIDRLYESRNKVNTFAVNQTKEKIDTINERIRSAKESMRLENQIIKGTTYTQTMLLNSLKSKDNTSSVREVTPKKRSDESEEQYKARVDEIKPVPLDVTKIVKVTSKSASILAKAPIGRVSEVGSTVNEMLINQIIPNTDGVIDIKKVSNTDLAKYPYLMMLLDDKGNINYNVAAALTTAVTKYIDEKKVSLVKLTDKDLESYFGVSENDIVNRAATGHLGIPIKYMASDIAKNIEKLLGLKPVEGKEEVYEKVILGLAQAAIYSEMGKNGLLKEVATTYGETGKAESITVKLKEDKYEELGRIKQSNKRLTDDFKVEYERSSFRTEKKDIEIKDVKILRNDLTKPSEEQAKAIVKYTNLEWYPNEDILDILTNLNDDVLRKLLGYESTEVDGITKSKLESRKGKNLQIESDIENLRELASSLKEGKLIGGAVFFDWTIWKVGRNAIESSGFNPQSIKLHRYAGTYKAQNGTVKKDDISEDIFKLGVAQALGFKVDKSSVVESKEFADSILNEEGMKSLENAIQNGNTEFKYNENTYKIKELSHSVMALVEGRKYVEAGGKDFKTSMVLESDGLTNGFAFKMLQYLVTKEDSFTLDTHLVEWLEKAGITVGEKVARAVVDKIRNNEITDAYRTLGMEIPNKVETLKDGETVVKYDTVEKTAIDGVDKTISDAESKSIFDSKDSAKIAAFMKQKEVLLHYDVLMEDHKGNFYSNEKGIKFVKDTIGKFLATRDSLTDVNGLITDAARELMKQPFMTYGYGAGFNSILNAVTSIVEEKLTDTLVQLDTESDAYKKAWEFAKAIGFTEDRKNELTKEFTPNIEVTTNHLKENAKSNLHKEIRNLVTLTYGKRIEEVLNEEFKALSQVNKEIIQAASTMFHIWKTVYNKLAGVEEGQVPSKEKHKEVMKKTWKIFPVVASPLGKDTLVDGIPLVSTKRETGVKNSFGNAKVALDNEVFDKSSASVQSIRETYDSIGVGAVVNMNQMIDGGTMTRVMNEFDIAQVFDALIIGVNQADAVSFINEVFGKFALSNEWSHIGAVSDRLSDIVFGRDLDSLIDEINKTGKGKPFTKEELFQTVENILRKEEGDKKVSKIPTVEKITENMAVRNYQNKKLRSELNENDVGFEQYVLDGKHVYNHTGKESAKGGSDIIDKIVAELTSKNKNNKMFVDMLNSISADVKGCR